MAQERRHKPRRRRRRGQFGFLYKLLSILLVTIAVIVACVVFFRVNVVTVVGNSRYTAQEIIDASGIRTGDNLIALSKSRVSSRILTGLPYIKSVAPRRVLPDGVVLTVTEHAAAAAVSDGSAWWYISSDRGKLLEQVSAPGQVIRVTGLTAVDPRAGERLAVSEEETARLSYVLSLLSVLEEWDLLGDCSALDCSGVGVIWLDYLDFRLKMPTTANFDYCFNALDKLFEEDGRVTRENSGTFDFTVVEGKIFYSPSKEN